LTSIFFFIFSLAACSAAVSNDNSVSNSSSDTTTGPVKITENTNSNPLASSNDNINRTMETAPELNPAKTPTEAYKRLFAAVKSGKTEEIKAAVSLRTQELAEMLAKRQNEPIEKVYSNGFSRTTMTDRLPEIRDERVKGGMGAVEVWNNSDQRWEDIPFIFENGSWKLAYGDLWQNVWQSPGPGRAAIDAQAANVNKPNSGMKKIELPKNVNAMVNPVGTPAKKRP